MGEDIWRVCTGHGGTLVVSKTRADDQFGIGELTGDFLQLNEVMHTRIPEAGGSWRGSLPRFPERDRNHLKLRVMNVPRTTFKDMEKASELTNPPCSKRRRGRVRDVGAPLRGLVGDYTRQQPQDLSSWKNFPGRPPPTPFIAAPTLHVQPGQLHQPGGLDMAKISKARSSSGKSFRDAEDSRYGLGPASRPMRLPYGKAMSRGNVHHER
jgi:predicted component of type VI protein secretion system